MSLPSQTARSAYTKNHMYRRKNLNFKLVISGLVLATVVIVVWVIFAKRNGGVATPPALVTDQMKAETPGKNNDVTKRTSTDGTDAKTQATKGNDGAPRLVMGEDVPALPLTEKTQQPQAQKPAVQPERVDPKTTIPNQPLASDTPQNQSPRALTQAQRLLEDGARQASAGRLVEARQTLSMALEQLDPNNRDAETARTMLNDINEILVFSEKVAPGDPYAKTHKIESGELLSTIAKPLGVDWRFVARINGIKDPSRIQAGQIIKVIDGQFHAVVRKSAFELDLYLGQGSDRVFVRSFPVGLGELDSTPVGRFAVASRVPNPSWKNPRTGEYFAPDDPKNPIGEFWVGLKGIEPKTVGMQGYGIHGTVEPDSIGTQASMGCVRMMPDDIALVYEMLTSARNTIEIVP